MENLVRRSVRTTVAVAGFAALGVGLAAPAFAVPSVPDVSGIGSVPANEQRPASPGFTQATSTLPGLFEFAPPSAEQSTSTEAVPAEQVPAEPAPGVLPPIPGPVAAQASPQVAGLPTDSAMQALDTASLF